MESRAKRKERVIQMYVHMYMKEFDVQGRRKFGVTDVNLELTSFLFSILILVEHILGFQLF
jgi:hypothetical protein